MTGRIENFIQRPLAIALGQKGLVDRVVTIEIAGQVLPRGIVIHHEQHIGIALSATGEIGQRGHIIVPDGTRSHSGQQLRHVIGRILQVFLQRVLELHLLVFQTRFQACSETLARTGRQRLKAAFNVTPGLFQLRRELLAVGPQTRIQIRLQRRHRAPCQCNRHQHLHQKSDT